jgi:hypothetical protein
MILYLISIFLKFLVLFVMLLLFKLIDPNLFLEPENVFSWDTSQVIRVLFCMIYIPEKFSSLGMLLFMIIFYPTLTPRSLIGSIFLPTFTYFSQSI